MYDIAPHPFTVNNPLWRKPFQRKPVRELSESAMRRGPICDQIMIVEKHHRDPRDVNRFGNSNVT